eukprot:4089774-Amphidinium_carterae.1
MGRAIQEEEFAGFRGGTSGAQLLSWMYRCSALRNALEEPEVSKSTQSWDCKNPAFGKPRFCPRNSKHTENPGEK